MAILRILTTEVGRSEHVFTLGDQPVRLGRADDNDVVLLEQSASRHHARIEPVEGGYEIVDLGSSGGLKIRGSRATRTRLAEGDEIVIGGTTIRFVERPGSEPTVLPTPDAPPSSHATEAGDESAAPAAAVGATDLEGADTMLPDAPGTDPRSAPTDLAHADTGKHATTSAPPPVLQAPAAVVLTGGTVPATHQPSAPPFTPGIEPDPMEPPKHHPSSDSSFVMGGPASSRPGGFAVDTVPPTGLSRGPGAGVYILLALVGAGASFGILAALQGAPW